MYIYIYIYITYIYIYISYIYIYIIYSFIVERITECRCRHVDQCRGYRQLYDIKFINITLYHFIILYYITLYYTTSNIYFTTYLQFIKK